MKKRILCYVADAGTCALIRIKWPNQWVSAHSDFEIRECNVINQGDVDWLLQGDKKVAIFQRQYGGSIFEHMMALKNHGVICGYESDDLVTGVQIANPAWDIAYGRPDIQRTIRNFLTNSDFVIVSTEGIAKYWRAFNKNTYVIENAINWKDLPIKEDEEFKIILTGSTSHIEDWANCISALEQLPYKIYTMGFHECLAKNRDEENLKPYKERKYVYPSNIIPQEWSPYGKYMEKLYELSGINTLGLCFIDEIPFNAGKSNLKMLEYAMTGSCILGNKFGPYIGHPVLYSKNRTYEIKKAIDKFRIMDVRAKKDQVIEQKKHFSKWDMAKVYQERIDLYNKIVGCK